MADSFITNQGFTAVTQGDRELVERQVKKILESRFFKSAKQMQLFLNYIVSKALTGEAQTLKQYTIAIEALGFPASFDSESNPIVRIIAGRVRKRLSDYYNDEGIEDPIIISIPKGSYTPAFNKPSGEQQARPKLITHRGDSIPPKLAILCYSDETQDKESNRLLFHITDIMAKELSSFLFLRLVVSSPHADKSRARHAATEIREQFAADYMLVFYIQQLPDKHILICQLIDVENEEILWSDNFNIISDESFYERTEVIAQISVIAADIQQGILHRHWSRKLLASGDEIPESSKALAYYRYYADNLTLDSFRVSVKACEKQLRTHPDDVICNVLYADYCRRDYVYGYGVIDSPLTAGKKVALNAIRLMPDSHEAHYALGQILFNSNDWERSKKEFRIVLKISKYHAYVTYGVGFHLYLMGEKEEGLGLVNKVMALTPSYPDWFNIIPYIDYYLKEDYLSALESVLNFHAPIMLNPEMTRCTAYAKLGDIKNAKKELAKIFELYPDFMAIGRDMFIRFVGSKDIADKFWEGIMIAHEAEES